jgi:hypothetical protein
MLGLPDSRRLMQTDRVYREQVLHRHRARSETLAVLDVGDREVGWLSDPMTSAIGWIERSGDWASPGHVSADGGMSVASPPSTILSPR